MHSQFLFRHLYIFFIHFEFSINRNNYADKKYNGRRWLSRQIVSFPSTANRCGAITRATRRITSTWTASSGPKSTKFRLYQTTGHASGFDGPFCYEHLCLSATWPCLLILPSLFRAQFPRCKCYSSAAGTAATSAPVSRDVTP